MRKYCWLGLLLLAGCQGVVGPRERRLNPVQVDDPRLSTERQERRAREQLANPQDDPAVGPPTYFGLPQNLIRR